MISVSILVNICLSLIEFQYFCELFSLSNQLISLSTTDPFFNSLKPKSFIERNDVNETDIQSVGDPLMEVMDNPNQTLDIDSLRAVGTTRVGHICRLFLLNGTEDDSRA